MMFQSFIISEPKPSHLAWTLIYTFFAVIFLGPVGAGIMGAVFAILICKWSIDDNELGLWMIILFFTIFIGLLFGHMFFSFKVMYSLTILGNTLLVYGLIALIYSPLRKTIEVKTRVIKN